jgi:redox-sensitive bicupin YhaK (pirin superfamily)
MWRALASRRLGGDSLPTTTKTSIVSYSGTAGDDVVVSGPVSERDAVVEPVVDEPEPQVFERYPSRTADVGGTPVRRALPRRERRTIGAWCFFDHFGPAEVAMRVGPHPHMGLQTVTWLLAGEVLHRDSLSSEQLIRPGQLNLMTAGRGVAHAEESPSGSPSVGHGAQLWVAQPESTRHGAAAFEHHADLPSVELGGWRATILLGALAGQHSPAATDTPIVGAALTAVGGRPSASASASSEVALDPSFEYGLVVLEGALAIGLDEVRPGELVYLGRGRESLPLRAIGTTGTTGTTTAMLLGGEPFAEPVLMWWNYVARTRAEVEEANAAWDNGSGRFGDVESDLARIPGPPITWRR